MTDETTARDRAIAWLEQQRREAYERGIHETQRHCDLVLRALAGAPTADVDAPPSLEASDVRRDMYPAPGQLAHESPRGVTLAHLPTGLVASCDTERSGVQNVRIAYERLRELVLTAAPAVEPEGMDVAARHGVTPEPTAGSEHYREGWRDGYSQRVSDVLAALDGDTTEES